MTSHVTLKFHYSLRACACLNVSARLCSSHGIRGGCFYEPILHLALRYMYMYVARNWRHTVLCMAEIKMCCSKLFVV